MNWKDNIIDDNEGIRRLLNETKRIAVVGMRSELYSDRPANYVPAYLLRVGFEVIPVPVYEPDATTMLGQKVYRSLAEVPGKIDLVDIFRRSEHLNGHLEDILAARPAAVWTQMGIYDESFGERLAQEGIKVVQDRCLMVEHRRLG